MLILNLYNPKILYRETRRLSQVGINTAYSDPSQLFWSLCILQDFLMHYDMITWVSNTKCENVYQNANLLSKNYVLALQSL